MLIKFSFSNFRSIKDEVTLSFEASRLTELEDYYVIQATEKIRLLKLGVIYGANASGKTNVLRALNFLRNLIIEPLHKKTDPITYNRFAFDQESKNAHSTFKVAFIAEGIKYEYVAELNNQAIASESLHFYNPKRALFFERKTDEVEQLTTIHFNDKKRTEIDSTEAKALELNTLWNNSVLGGFLQTNVSNTYLKAVTEWFKDYLMPLVWPGTDLLGFITNKIEKSIIRKEIVINILKQGDFNISDVSIEDKNLEYDDLSFLSNFDNKEIEYEQENMMVLSGLKKVEFKHSIDTNGIKKEFFLNYLAESQGTQRYYQFAGLLALMMLENKMLLIDELEASLHPDLLKHFLLTFLINTTHSQIVCTTHFRELLKEKEILRSDVIKFCEKNEQGATELYAFTDFDSSIIRSSSSIYNAYKIGKLGAVPFLSDAYIPQD